MMTYIIPILALAALCAGWVVVQIIAKKAKTKNHFDDLDGSTCGNCTCGGLQGACNNEDEVEHGDSAESLINS